MANEILITDLVAQEALDQLEQLDRKMEGTLEQFKDCAMELAKGIKIPVEVSGDLEKLRELSNATMQKASQAAQQYTQQLQQQQQVIANTTNTISRQLMEQEKLNKVQREAFEQDQEAQQLAKALLGTRQQNYELLARYKKELEDNKAAQKRVNEEEKNGLITQEQAIQKRAALMAAYDKTKTASQELTKILAAENREANAAQGSYQQLSQRLERLKQAYKQMNDAQKASAGGQAIEKEIQNLDAHLKDLSADMGEHQRNVGNYAIAAQNMKGTLRELTEEIAQLTLQYNELSDEEQRSDIGMQMRDKITKLTEEAGKYKDIISDVKQSISGSASDTRLFDSLIEAGQVFAATMGVAETACRALGMSEDSLQQSMLKVQQAMQAVQALQVIQNTLQKQSNLMKGIAIIQSKAAAAAAKIEAAATAQATGATVAQTIAMKAFNAVAKANPYVLLATAILAVIGLIVGYTSATEEATEADKKAAEAKNRLAEANNVAANSAVARKKVEEDMADTVSSSVSKQLANYTFLQKKWEECGNDITKQNKFLKDYKKELDNTGFSVKNVYDAHNILVKQAPNVIDMYYALAEAAAAAAVAEDAFKRKLERRYKNTIENGGKYYKTTADYSKLSADEKALLHEGDYSTNWLGNPDKLMPFAMDKIDKYRESKARELRESLNKEDDAIIESALKLKADVEQRAKNLQGVIGTAFSREGGVGGGTKGGGSGDKKTDKSKSLADLQDADNKYILEALNKNGELIEEFSDKWLEVREAAVDKQVEVEKAANKKRYDELLADLDASKKAKKITEEQYLEEKSTIDQAYDDIDKAIDDQAVKRKKEFADEILKDKQKKAKDEVTSIAEAAANEQIVRDKNYNDAVTKLYKEYTEELKIAQQKGEETTKITEKFNKRKEELDNQYANATVQATIDALQKELEVAGLSEEERERLQRELTEQTTQLAQQRAEQEKDAIEEVVKADEEALKKRQKNAQEWVQRAGEAVQKIGDFVSAMYDNQISKIDELLEEEQTRYDAEVSHISELAEHGAITTEEAEIRKRDAAAATAVKQEQLEKKKAQIEYRKALMEKANTISQIGIATALGIMQALAMMPPNIPLSVFIGAMGAIQVATALAQPIKAYAEGTKGKPHPGGFAIVGDAYKPEAVILDGKAWITPDSPTLVDLPRGAQVIPDINEKDIQSMGALLPMSVPRDKLTGQPIVINDYSTLESRVASNTKAVTQSLNRFERNVTRQMRRQKFNAYLNSRI